MPALPFNVDEPPSQPPEQCVSPLMWQLAHQLYRDHRPDLDGFCVTCVPGEFCPCVGRYLAMRGFLAACGLPDLPPIQAPR